VGKYGSDNPSAVPPLHEPYANVAALGAWIHRHEPDAIVSGAYYVLDMLRELKISAPDQLGVACPCIPFPETELSGIFEDWKCLGEIAVDAVVAMLNRAERGAPVRPQRLHVEGPWIAGRTLRAQRAD
jgi:LacI family transcriptional regulator/LacI family repressor for deo operon, udp, cdd, tsx, nupC, and nupG